MRPRATRHQSGSNGLLRRPQTQGRAAVPANGTVIPTTALQDAVALLTVAVDAADDHELQALVDEFRSKDDSDELLLAVVALCRSLCLAVSKMVHVVDDELSNGQADALTEDELLPSRCT